MIPLRYTIIISSINTYTHSNTHQHMPTHTLKCINIQYYITTPHTVSLWSIMQHLRLRGFTHPIPRSDIQDFISTEKVLQRCSSWDHLNSFPSQLLNFQPREATLLVQKKKKNSLHAILKIIKRNTKK